MRVYVASKFENTLEVHRAQQLLRDHGHVVTHDWTAESTEGMAPDKVESYLKGCGQKDFEGVVTADVLLLINHPLGKGMFVEMGLALGRDIPILVVFPERAYNIFFRLDGVQKFDSIEEAVNEVDGMALDLL